ncbi:MAG: hypothetical protein MJZ73_12115 [Bacteroidaceae bacterium]|nr:hypothetical protein [Bacteroidaceae bacterium]
MKSMKSYANLLADYEAKCAEFEKLREEYLNLSEQMVKLLNVQAELARHSDHDVLEKVLRKYLGESTNKSTKKKESIRTIIWEISRSAHMQVSEEFGNLIDDIDNETTYLPTAPVTHIDRQEIYESGSTKNENCRQLTAIDDKKKD